jgi:putative modified peptide
MSHVNVERVIGQLVTDEAFRRRFTSDPSSALQDLAQGGIELNPCEVQALLCIDPRALARCADAIDPRLQKTDLRGEAT